MAHFKARQLCGLSFCTVQGAKIRPNARKFIHTTTTGHTMCEFSEIDLKILKAAVELAIRDNQNMIATCPDRDVYADALLKYKKEGNQLKRLLRKICRLLKQETRNPQASIQLIQKSTQINTGE